MGIFNRREKRNNLSLYVGGKRLSDVINSNNSTVVFCENLIANTISTLPFILYFRGNDSIYKAYNHPMYKLVVKRPNENETPAVFFSLLVRQLIGGNAFIKKIKYNKEIVQLIILDNKKVKIINDGLVKRYEYDGEVLSSSDIIHIPSAYGYDGIKGKSVLEYAQSVVNDSNTLANYTKSYFSNNILTKLKVSMNKANYSALSDDDIKRFAEFYTDAGTAENAGRPIVEFDGVEVSPLNLQANATDELIKSREYTDRLICQIYGVPYSLLDGSNKYNSYEQFNLFFRTHTLTQYTDRIEQYLTAGLLTDDEQERYYFECDYSEVLRPDSEAKQKMTIENFRNGLITLNEARRELGYQSAADKVAGESHIMQGFGVVRQDVIEAYAAGAKLKQSQLDEINQDNKAK